MKCHSDDLDKQDDVALCTRLLLLLLEFLGRISKHLVTEVRLLAEVVVLLEAKHDNTFFFR
jgi:hypothetical protein